MGSQRTINGHNKPKKPGEEVINLYSQTTAKQDEQSRRALERAISTYANRSEETKAKQAKALAAKQEATTRAKELEQIFLEEFNSDLIDKIIASFDEVGIDKTLKRFESDLKTFKTYSDEYADVVKIISSPRTFSYYDELLYNLARKYPKFIMYLPAQCFTYGGAKLNLSKLSKEDLQILEDKLTKTDVFKNPVFKRNFIKYFPSHITEMHEIADIAYALSLNPTCFKKLDPQGSLRLGFCQNPQPFLTIVKNAPEVLKYSTNNELYLFANNFGSQTGVAINKCPQVLENFPLNFFEKFSPKLIFAEVNKSQLRSKIMQYFERFPILEIYFSSNKMKPKLTQAANSSQSSASDPISV